MPLTFDPPPDPADTREWTREVEEEVAALVERSLRGIVTRATDDYVRSFGASLTAAGDPSAFDGIPVAWQTFVLEEFDDTIGGIYLNGAVTAFMQAPGSEALTEAAVEGWTAVVNEDAVTYSRGLVNRMSDVGDRLWLDLRQSVTTAVQEGMSTDDLSAELQRVGQFSEYRATMIARTEVHAAMNAGKIEGDLTLGEFGPVEKIWLSSLDARVRETHVAANGQTVPITEPFVVGGASLMVPGDTSGPAAEVINCRCTYLRLFPGDVRPDGSIVPERDVLPETTNEPTPVEPDVEPTQRRRRTKAEMEEARRARAAEVAEQYEVSVDEILMRVEDVAPLRDRARAEAAERAFEVHGQLDAAGLGSFSVPDPRSIDRASRVYVEWIDNLAPQERSRLRQNGWVTRTARDADVIDDAYTRAAGLESTGLPGQVLEEYWLPLTRDYDLLQQAARGRTPQNFARYGGNPDYNRLLPRVNADGFDANVLMRADDIEVAAMIARREIVEHADEALALIADADAALLGPSPWRMSFMSWEDEVRLIEYRMREGLALADDAARYDELVPRRLDTGQDYEELYATIVEVAGLARRDVADWATIPWR